MGEGLELSQAVAQEPFQLTQRDTEGTVSFARGSQIDGAELPAIDQIGDVHLADSQQGGGLFTLEQQRCKAGAWGVGIGFIRSIRG